MFEAAPEHEFMVIASPDAELSLIEGAANATILRIGPSAEHRLRRVLSHPLLLDRVVRRRQPHVYFSVCNTAPLPRWFPIPSVVAVHSLQFLVYPGEFGWLRATYLKRSVESAVRSCRRVITVSKACAADIARYFDVDISKIHVTYPGMSSPPLDLSEVQTAAPYVLAISTLYGFKNYERLIEGFADGVVRRGLPHQLLIIGGDADVSAQDLRRFAKRLGIEKRVQLLGAVSQAALGGYLHRADLFAYPSLYETFGQPPLEAMSAGVPVVASDVPAIREVSGEAAYLVNPLSTQSIADGLHSVLSTTETRIQLIERGYERVRQFRWDSCARSTLEALGLAREVPA
jgi:glycosyltransferase involved in cell wall biosynthesis